jgi:hypothetical protein
VRAIPRFSRWRVLLACLAVIASVAVGAGSQLPALAAASTQFSGTLVDSNGVPVSNAEISLSGSSGSVNTTTASDGSFSVFAAAGEYSLGIGVPGAPDTDATGSEDFNASLDLSSDLTGQTLTIPALVPLTVQVTDSNGDAVPDASVGAQVTTCSLASFQLLSGVAATGEGEGYELTPVNGYPQTTDSNGEVDFLVPQCASDFSGYIDVTPPSGSSLESLEEGFNSDGIDGIDSFNGPTTVTAQITNYAAVTSVGAVNGTFTIESPTGTTITGVSNAPAPTSGLPAGAVILTGATTYEVTGVAPAQTVDVNITLPAGSDPTNVYKIDNGTYTEVTSEAAITGNTIVLQLTNDGTGDSIIDPVVPVRITTENPIDTVAFNSDGGAALASLSGLYGSSITLPSDTYPGYRFNGWFTHARGGTTVGGAGVGYTIPVGGITLYAQWTKKTSQTIVFGTLAKETLAQSSVTVSATASSGLTVTFASTTAAVCISGGTNGATITFVTTGKCTVQASQGGNSIYNAKAVSRSFTVSKASQTITFGTLANQTLAESPLTVAATASSGLPVTFTTTPAKVCTAGGVNGATITLIKAGTCTVKASQAGNSIYKAAPKVSQTFTVG